ncbi:diuretic hormone 1 isoform X4 [Plutella xylostella]|uniref:diuretic hormone 1 isoform X4 n=1 Tax=Plutella xylostella TaxID=51655 RepID=UPI0018D0FD59|nr:diuretic hormone 1 isoform X4 [Plutella xylostella]
MMWWAMWCAAVLAGSAGCAPAEPGLDLAPVDQAAPDDEGLSYAVPPMGGRYEGAPWLYLLADLPRESQVKVGAEYMRRRRGGLSVNPAVEHLQRNILNAHIEHLAHRNRNFLNCVGKRDPWSTADCMATN